MKFINEIKHRVCFIILCWFFIFNISYYYKNILLFLLLKNIIYNQTINFYLIYTSISELFNLYFKIINFLVINIIIYFLLYHIFIFINNGLYLNEYKLVLTFISQFLIISLILSFSIVVYLFPLIWKFFEQFKQAFTFNIIHFEIKLNEYYLIFLNIYTLFKYFLLTLTFILLLLKNVIDIKILKKIRKIVGTLLLLLIIVNDIFICFILYLLFLFLYEFIIFYLIYIQYYKVK